MPLPIKILRESSRLDALAVSPPFFLKSFARNRPRNVALDTSFHFSGLPGGFHVAESPFHCVEPGIESFVVYFDVDWVS